MLKEKRCNLCGSNNYKVVYKGRAADIASEKQDYRITDHPVGLPLRVVKCRKCGLIYANPHPSPRRLLSNYNKMVDELYVEEEKGRRLSAQSIIRELREFKKKQRILDLGCATGFLLDEARKKGWEVYGVELSRWAVNYAKNKLGINTIFHGILKNANYPDNYFDAVVMKDAIEHLTDPKATLIEIQRVLKPGGILCINTPNIDSLIGKILRARWWGVKQSHLYYFTPKTLYKMLRLTGFEPIKCKSHVRIFTLKYWVSKFMGYNETLGKIFMFLIRHRIIKNDLFRVDFKDQIEVYAIKTI